MFKRAFGIDRICTGSLFSKSSTSTAYKPFWAFFSCWWTLFRKRKKGEKKEKKGKEKKKEKRRKKGKGEIAGDSSACGINRLLVLDARSIRTKLRKPDADIRSG